MRLMAISHTADAAQPDDIFHGRQPAMEKRVFTRIAAISPSGMFSARRRLLRYLRLRQQRREV